MNKETNKEVVNEYDFNYTYKDNTNTYIALSVLLFVVMAVIGVFYTIHSPI